MDGRRTGSSAQRQENQSVGDAAGDIGSALSRVGEVLGGGRRTGGGGGGGLSGLGGMFGL